MLVGIASSSATDRSPVPDAGVAYCFAHITTSPSARGRARVELDRERIYAGRHLFRMHLGLPRAMWPVCRLRLRIGLHRLRRLRQPGTILIRPRRPALHGHQHRDASSRFLRRHVQSFLRHMFPIWPVVRANKTLANCSDPESLPLKGYCFLTALCAAASVQLNLESTRCEFEADEPADERHECYPRITPDYLLSEVLRMRSTLDIAEEPDLDTLLTSCFLFSANANLERHNQAWFYLSQSIFFALALQLHDEQAYSEQAFPWTRVRATAIFTPVLPGPESRHSHPAHTRRHGSP